MNAVVLTYLAYLAISIGLTTWVGRTLHRNGRVFLVDVFRGNDALADSVNHLLVVGFYLINLGFIARSLSLGYVVTTGAGAIEAVSSKVGLVALVLGGMHFLNLYVFSRMRRRALLPSAPAPVDPDALLAPTNGARAKSDRGAPLPAR